MERLFPKLIPSIQERLCDVNSFFVRMFDLFFAILIVSFQAEHTLGRRLLEGASPVRIFGDEYEVRAEMAHINGYSAHADQQELLAWADSFDKQRLRKIFLVHGEEETAMTLAKKLRAQGHREVAVSVLGQTVPFS